MPLPDDKFTRGKGGFKLVQYMSIGLPCIASNVGYNSKIVSRGAGFLISDDRLNEWIAAIVRMSDIGFWSSASKIAFNEWNLRFSFQNQLEFWRRHLN